MNSHKNYCIFLLLFFSWLFLEAQNNNDPLNLLNNEIELLKKDPCLKNASWSVMVSETATGKQLCGYNVDMVLEPASVMKIVTTGAALSLLGSSFVFETRLEYSGTIDPEGNLIGNLYITGGGDPTIGSKRFDGAVSTDSIFYEFYRALKQNNIRHIKGSVVADASFFEENPAAGSWLWEDIGNYYASGAYGLNINENSYRIYFDAGVDLGSPALLNIKDPELNEMEFINNVKTGKAGSGDNVIIYGSPYTNVRMLEGTVPVGKTNFDVDGSLTDPPAYFAKLFSEYIYNKGIIADSATKTNRKIKWEGKTDSVKRKILALHKSPELKEIVVPTNTKSVNLFAEAILKTIGRIKKDKGSETAGVEAVKNFWASKNIDLKGFEMEDGCGLSRKNKISTRQLCEMLKILTKEKAYTDFSQSLPLAGKTGGMAAMLKGTIAENNLRAKTGNMDKIKSYAGYVKNISGKNLCFALVFNNYTCSNSELKPKIEKLLLLIAQTK